MQMNEIRKIIPFKVFTENDTFKINEWKINEILGCMCGLMQCSDAVLENKKNQGQKEKKKAWKASIIQIQA